MEAKAKLADARSWMDAFSLAFSASLEDARSMSSWCEAVYRGAAGDVQVQAEEVGDEVRSSASQVGGKGSRRASNGGEEDKMDQGGARRRGGGCGALLELRGGAQAVGGEV